MTDINQQTIKTTVISKLKSLGPKIMFQLISRVKVLINKIIDKHENYHMIKAGLRLAIYYW